MSHLGRIAPPTVHEIVTNKSSAHRSLALYLESVRIHESPSERSASVLGLHARFAFSVGTGLQGTHLTGIKCGSGKEPVLR
jgi:hypothetical protein